MSTKAPRCYRICARTCSDTCRLCDRITTTVPLQGTKRNVGTMAQMRKARAARAERRAA